MSESYSKLRKDDDGHWYLIPVESIEVFEYLIDEGDYDEIYSEFDEYRIDHPYDILISCSI